MARRVCGANEITRRGYPCDICTVSSSDIALGEARRIQLDCRNVADDEIEHRKPKRETRLVLPQSKITLTWIGFAVVALLVAHRITEGRQSARSGRDEPALCLGNHWTRYSSAAFSIYFGLCSVYHPRINEAGKRKSESLPLNCRNLLAGITGMRGQACGVSP